MDVGDPSPPRSPGEASPTHSRTHCLEAAPNPDSSRLARGPFSYETTEARCLSPNPNSNPDKVRETRDAPTSNPTLWSPYTPPFTPHVCASRSLPALFSQASLLLSLMPESILPPGKASPTFSLKPSHTRRPLPSVPRLQCVFTLPGP